MIFTCEEILNATNGNLLQGDIKQRFTGISTDSRMIKEGELFVALKGPNFDGHHFVLESFEKNAGGALIEEDRVSDIRLNTHQSKSAIIVKDTLRALGDIARQTRRNSSAKVIALTGSNGKTTTKEMIASCLESSFPILKTEGNMNNLIGLPLTLFKLKGDEKAVILEMGMNIAGEIKRLTEIAGPDIGLITNIEKVHLEGLGDIEKIKNEKGELFKGVSEDGVILINQDDPRVVEVSKVFKGRKISFGVKKEADMMAKEFRFVDSKGIEFTSIIDGDKERFFIPLLGKQFISNALCAIAVSKLFDIGIEKIKNALMNFKQLPMRMELISLGRGINLINDAYNANPKSMEYALETLSTLKGRGRAIAVLGSMMELGNFTEEAHRAVGELVGRLSIDFLIAIGNESAILVESAIRSGLSSGRAKIIESHYEAVFLLKKLLREGDWVLVKGSRRMAMEKIIQYLLHEANQ